MNSVIKAHLPNQTQPAFKAALTLALTNLLLEDGILKQRHLDSDVD